VFHQYVDKVGNITEIVDFTLIAFVLLTFIGDCRKKIKRDVPFARETGWLLALLSSGVVHKPEAIGLDTKETR
jgi:hypothetical protein